ncbi:MAG: hypothetical protein ACXVGN_00180 [Mycobacteriaceae bacterium]
MVNHIYDETANATLCADYKGELAREISWGRVSCSDCLAAEKHFPAPASVFTTVAPPFELNLEDILVEINEMMVERHRKYGPGNIAEFGDLGILVRMSDKFARLKSGRENFDDETIENTLDDIIGYSLIWKMWVRKQWPGSLADDVSGK